MAGLPIVVPELMQHRALQLGEPGELWLEGIRETLVTVADDWHLDIGPQLSGGTEALVFLVNHERTAGVLKVGIPHSLVGETRTLQLAEGQGYAKLLKSDAARNVLLLERLGSQLAEAKRSVADKIETICATLTMAWRPLESPGDLTTGVEKARAQAAYIRSKWAEFDRPCTRAVLDLALDYAHQRELSFAPEDSCLVHGDAHMWNTLEAPSSPTGYKFVDPDGLFAEPALDLAISLREWRKELLVDDALDAGQRRCEFLSELTKVDSEAIWQWGFIEHVSCGLLDLSLNDHQAAAQHFAIVQRWSEL